MAGSEVDRVENAGADAALKAFLANAGDARCPSCGYALTGVTLARCPECGMPLDVELLRDGPEASQPAPQESDPHIDWWMVLAPAAVVLAIAALTWLIQLFS